MGILILSDWFDRGYRDDSPMVHGGLDGAVSTGRHWLCPWLLSAR